MKKLSFMMIMLLTAMSLSAQNIRYVSSTNGDYANDGKSWASPKLNIQDAINDLVNNKLTGEVWVAAGTYTPTESTESSGGSTLYMSFKIPQGITVRGGFRADLTASDDGKNDQTTRPRRNYTSIGWFYENHTVLSGNLSSKAKFAWNNERQQWETSFYGNTYHVVWFATKGFNSEGRANPVNTADPTTTPESQLAVLEGCVVTGGNAHNNTVTGRSHNAYGGGIYMVAGSKVENCYVYNCEASRDGGGIYMDGGGYAAHVFVQDCQALGIGVQNGYGGGIAIDGVSASADATHKKVKTYLTRSGIAGCVGRMGGGLAYNTYDTSIKFNACASAVLVANNTATTEGGGIYVNRGAALAHVTVVNNKCNGTGITIGGMQTGRAGGIYIRDNAHLVNSVIWGNKCAANQDIQYASSRSSSSDALKPSVQFTMLSKSDHADWSGTVKYKVEKLSDYNTLQALTDAGATKGESEAFPMFNIPSTQAGAFANVGIQTITTYDWQINSRSAMTNHGVLTYDLDIKHETPAPPQTQDILGELYSARVTLGAYNSKAVAGMPEMYALDGSGNKYFFNFTTGQYTGISEANIVRRVANLFVDPDESDLDETTTNASSWDTPAKYLADLLYYVKTWWNDDDPAHAFFRQLDEINIYVKQGTVYNTSAHYTGHVRNATLEIPHLQNFGLSKTGKIQLNIIGSMDRSLTGTDVSKRDPVHTPTIISGEIMEDYDLNASHLVTFNGCQDVTFDGFQLRYGNAKSEKLENTNLNGAAMTFTRNGAQCDGVQVKNVLVAGCTAVNGAAVYITDGSRNISFENCIFHNNQVNYKSTQQANGIVYIGSGSTGISFDHCDILRNVGYAFENNGSMTITNSMVYANMSKVLEATSGQAAFGLAPFAVKGTVTGHHNLFDTKATDVSALGDNTLSFNKDEANYPRFVNSTKNAGVSQKGDVTYFGRAASFEPTNVNPMVNAASYVGEHTTWGTDMSTNTTRDYGGLPDIGAIENHIAGSAEGENANKDGQLPYGGAYYVRDYLDNSGNIKNETGDGSSWAGAINGNMYFYGDGSHSLEKTKLIGGYLVPTTYKKKYTRAAASAAGIKDPRGVVLYQSSRDRYLQFNNGNLVPVQNVQDATVFIVEGNNLYTIDKARYVSSNGNDLIKSTPIGYNVTGANTNKATATFNHGTASNWTFSDNRISVSYRTNNSTVTRYIRMSSTTAVELGTSTYYSQFTPYYLKVEDVVDVEEHMEGGSIEYGIPGLQYAVNLANAKFVAEGKSEQNKKTVYAGAGTYTNATGKAEGTTFTSAELAKHLVSQPYAYEMKEGVDVYGGFPATGNPGMSERDPKVYETILQPQKNSPYVTLGTHKKYSGDYEGYVPTNWGANANATEGNEQASVGRVLVQPSDFTVETMWDGFTLRHGYLLTARMKNIGEALSNLSTAKLKTAGGAGALLQEKGHLANCVVKENLLLCYPGSTRMTKTGDDVNNTIRGTKTGVTHNDLYTYHLAGAGIFMTGNTNGAIVENCELAKNQILTKGYNRTDNVPDNIWMYGGGIFQDNGNVFNTTIHDNDAATIKGSTWNNSRTGNRDNNEMILGAGAFIADGNCYNNTIVNNMSASIYWCHNNHCTFAGIHVKDKAKIYNTIVADNVSHWGYEHLGSGTDPGNGVPVSAFEDGATGRDSRDQTKVHVTYSYVDVNVGATGVDLISYHDDQKSTSYNYGKTRKSTNIYINRKQYTTETVTNQNPASSVYYQNGATGTTDANRYHLKDKSPSINTGTSTIAGVDIPDYDADYTRRIKDCEIDMGAYEYNGSYAITPDVTTYPGTTPETGDAIYYVTPNGMGLSSASNPANAACAGKLQEVLDAAGRYKFQNPGKRVIVKVANSYAMANPDNGTKTPTDPGYIVPSDFGYTATRTTDEADENARIWSIMIPHGVEVWGGYSDVHPTEHTTTNLTNTVGENGFYRAATQADKDAGLATTVGQTIDARDITGNLTVFSGWFNNTVENTQAQSYHVVAFTDRIFDAEGHPYLKDDNLSGLSTYSKGGEYEESDFKHMSDEKTLINHDGTRDQHRAVIDGIYITGGNANGEETSPLNNCGGAAIVTDFAQVRNCIIEDNDAHNGGGLAVLQRGLVSGTLFLNNTAELGGAMYIVPHGTEIAPTLVGSWGSTTVEMVHVDDEGKILNWTDAPAGKSMGWNMSHIFTTTIVANTATKQGGGIYYANEGNPNTRVNSSVIWNNDAPDQANVAGIVSPDKPDDNTASTLTFFPFGYTAIQNVRASGTNNIKVESDARRGVRWEDLNTDPYYGITDYSVLTRTGMPIGDYDAVVSHYNVATHDFAALDRKVAGTGSSARSFIDMGARAVDKQVLREQLMLRLFVAQAEDVDVDAMNDILDEIHTNHSSDNDYTYYAQEGSSFAYPMQHLQDALDYIYWARSEKSAGVLNHDDANNLPFEIIVGKGTYFPTRDLQGNYGESTANTFLIPEGVSIVGGFDSKDNYTYDGSGNITACKFYGRYLEKDEIHDPTSDTYYITDNTKKLGKTSTSPVDYEPADLTMDLGAGKNYTILHRSLDTMKEHRVKDDINKNNIIEPWEFQNETVLDGDAVNSTHARVYHVLTAFPDQNLVGMLPKRSIERNEITYNDGMLGQQYFDREEGQSINLNGLTVTNGEAYNYIPGSLDEMSAYSYYHGGALLVDGNRYLDQWNKKAADTGDGWSSDGKTRYMHQGVTNAVGYRDIPVAISQCKFVNNVAGYGGAISANTTVDIFNSSFEKNMAKAGEEHITFNSEDKTIQFPGQGGAVYSTHQFSAFNTIFANNEALDNSYGITKRTYKTLRTQTGGAEIIGGTGGAIYSGMHGQFHLVNCNLVRNQANAYPAVFTMNPNYAAQRYFAGGSGDRGATITTPEYNQLVNCIIWGNDVNKGMASRYDSNPYFKFASRLICNFGIQGRNGADYDPTFKKDNVPSSLAELDATDAFEETAWFSAYENERGMTQNNAKDFRDSDYRPYTHAHVQLGLHAYSQGWGTNYENGYQNCNISIDPDNSSLEGPNFISPSVDPGYEGHKESADWSPARLNKMTDMGSGKILQIITINGTEYESVFPTYAAQGKTVPSGRSEYSIESDKDVQTAGAYTMTRFMKNYRHYNDNLPLGKEYYMESANSSHQQLYRISYDPNPTHNQTYIDIGVYEYPHTELHWDTKEGNEVDIIWVSAGEKPENGLPEGSDWSQPTSDLQRAIETLLASRNGHRKEIRLMDGTYAPIYTINDSQEDHLAFYFDTKQMNDAIMLPLEQNGTDSYGQPVYVKKEGLGIKSLTIKGGYSSELMNMYDVEQYPAIIRGQKRTDQTSAKWDHLFYINDMTQRYGYDTDRTEYAPGNEYGWQGVTGTPSEGVQARSVIPLEIDGVTFVNDQARASQKGAAIYYADQTFESEAGNIVRKNGGSIQALAPQPAVISHITQYYRDEAKTIKSDVPTMFYDATTDYTLDNPAKFVMSKSKVMASGKKNESTSAVYIGKEGGEAIFYNNVFHSNYGSPLEAYAAKLINNTLAKNGGTMEARDYQGKNNLGEATNYTSLAYNNVFWENGQLLYGARQQFLFYLLPERRIEMGLSRNTFDGNTYNDLSHVGSFFKRNAYSVSNAQFYSLTDYLSGQALDLQQNYNVGLVSENEDVINGPNFVDPDNADREARDFSLKPSLRLLNKGDDALYSDGISFDSDKNMSISGDYPDGKLVYDIAWLFTTNHDAASNKRRVFQIDLGAYEYQNKLERVLYVNPNSPSTGTGTTWASPIGKGNLQAAVDLAGVYAVNNESQVAYVFVKGANLDNKTLHTGETITLRNGVQIYGGIDPLKNKDVAKVTDEYTDETIADYIEELKAERLGVADANSYKTNISGIRTSTATRFNPAGDTRQVIVDGFVVTPDGTATAPALNINPNPGDGAEAKMAIRNIIVHDFDMTSQPALNVANFNNALLYEALFRDNKPAGSNSVLNMGTAGYGFNLTVEGKTVGTTDNIHNSLINYPTDVAQTLSGYSYPLEDKNLNYQLAEGSKQIDACDQSLDENNPANLPERLRGFIDYSSDRDLLGNPRLLQGVSNKNWIDRGAFETWKVENNTICNTNADEYYGNKYPHAGSVVYITEGKSLVSAHDFEPGYLLVQKGASLFGEGYDVNAAYVAVEREVLEDGSIVSMPFDMNYKTGVAKPTVDPGTGVLSLDYTAGGSVYGYDGNARADWQYNFQDANSKCWYDAAGTQPASRGVLFVPNSASTLRFTGKGSSMTDYIYTESGASKTIELTQYNDGGRDTHENGNTGDNADFTDKDDMGWNAIGLPYLVSKYETQAKVTDADATAYGLTGDAHTAAVDKYMMHIPHTLWMYYDGKKYRDGTTDANGDGGFYSVNSWDTEWHMAAGETASIWVGEGFFTQTATLEPTETLTFYRPIAPASFSEVKTERWYLTDEIRDVEEAEGKEIVATRYYTPDGIQHAKPVKGVTLQVDIYSDGTQKSHKYLKKR